MGNTTDSLLAAARSVTPESPDRLMGALLATGEEASVALLTLALAAERVRAVGFNAWRLPLRTRGSLRDADPVAVDTTRIQAVLGVRDAIVFPGFVGVDETGVPSLLGRGGSDLTALFLGDALGAAEVRLVKDVDGIFPADPRCGRGSGPHRTRGSGVRTAVSRAPCSTLTWSQARTIGGGVVQPKANRFRGTQGTWLPGDRVVGEGDECGKAASVAGGTLSAPVAVLGATGIVGQRLVRMLDGHPLFHLAEAVGSGRRAGQRYGDAVPWVIGGDPPPGAAALEILAHGKLLRSRVVLSALPSSVARETEPALADAGHIVCTNASAHRMRSDTPLIVPEVNAEAIGGVAAQPWSASGGALVANPNCVVVGLALALAPIERAFGIESATLVTLQALSGAGLSGLNAVEVAGNVIPDIRGEEEKIGPELNKILDADIEVAVAVNRVPVIDGHTAHVFCKLRAPATHPEAVRVLRDYRSPLHPGSLPTLPARPLVVRTESDRPQPRLDADAEAGMAVTVGRIRPAPPPHDLALVVVVHNGIRGAAGACLANAELCLAHLGPGALTPPGEANRDRHVKQILHNVNRT